MSNFDLLAALAGEPPHPGRVDRCLFRRVLDTLPADTAALTLTRVNDPAWSDRHIADLLAKAGHPVRGRNISAHRLNDCACRHSQNEATA